jgi:hypothetical protein
LSNFQKKIILASLPKNSPQKSALSNIDWGDMMNEEEQSGPEDRTIMPRRDSWASEMQNEDRQVTVNSSAGSGRPRRIDEEKNNQQSRDFYYR